MADEYQKKYRIPSLTTDAIVLRKHKDDNFHDILLVTRGNEPYKEKLAFPGGFVEYGEEPEIGCIRELKEETELDGKNIELLTVRGNPKRDPRRHVVSIFYIVNVEPDAQPKGGDDAKDAKFYELKDILENKKKEIAFDHYGVIEELVQKKFKDLYNIKDSGKLKIANKINFFNNYISLDKKLNLTLEKIEKLKLNESIELNDLINQKKEFENIQIEAEKLYEEKLNIIRDKISEINLQKWKVFDEKVNKMRELKLKKENLDKKITEIKDKLEPSEKLKSEKKVNNIPYKIRSGPNNFPYSGNLKKENLKSEEKNKPAKTEKKSISISTENQDNAKTVSVFEKVKEVLDKTVEKVKEVAKEDIKKEPTDENKKKEIAKIKKITNDAIDEINKLTKFVIEQSNDLIEKLNGNATDKIIYNDIKKERELKCEKCNKNIKIQNINQITHCSYNKNSIVHKGVRCNGCGAFIWEDC